MTSEEFGSLLVTLARAWADRRYENAVASFAPDVQYIDPVRYAIRGRDQLLAFFRTDDGLPQITTWRHIFFNEATQVGVAEYSYRGTQQYHGVVLVKLSDRKIARWREYQHISELGWEEFFQGAAF